MSLLVSYLLYSNCRYYSWYAQISSNEHDFGVVVF